VLGQDGAEAAVIAALTAGMRELQADGAQVLWKCDTIRPGRLPGMEIPGIGPVTLHTVQIHGSQGARHAGLLQQRLDCLEGSTGPGTLISCWVAEDTRDCTLLGVHRGAIPIVVEACRSCQTACGGKLIMMAGGLAIIGIDPAVLDAFLATADIEQWIPELNPPVRLEIGVRTRGGASDGTPVRIRYAAAGHDQRWLVDAGEGLDCDVYARAASRLIGTAVTASPVLGLDERSGTYYAMILLRTGPEGVAAREGLLACDRPLRVGGSVFSVRRYTHVRTQVRRLPEGDGPTMLFHRTADDVRDWPRRRTAQTPPQWQGWLLMGTGGPCPARSARSSYPTSEGPAGARQGREPAATGWCTPSSRRNWRSGPRTGASTPPRRHHDR
jgi:hypothetical protein